MSNLVFIQNDRVVTDSLMVAEVFGKDHKNVVRDIEGQIQKLNEANEHKWGALNFEQTYYVHPQNKQQYKKYILTEEAFTLVTMSYVTVGAMKFKVRFINEFKRMKEELNKQFQPKTQAEMMLLYAQQMVEQERKVTQLEVQMTTVNHRLDNIDKLDTIGDLKQRLNTMVRKYANDNGINYGFAWREFKNRFNTAYRTNLTSRINHHKGKHGLKKLTIPQFLEETGQLEDAIRVADKLLNS